MESFKLPKDIGPEAILVIGLINNMATALGLQPVIEGGMVHGPRHEEVLAKLTEMVAVEEKVQQTEYQLRSLGMQMRREGEAALTCEEVYRRLPKIIEQAKLADGQVNQLRALALKWFDSANVNPTKKDMPDHLKKMRARIEKSTDADFIEEQLSLYEEMTRERFKVLGQEPPNFKMTKPAPKPTTDPLKAAEIADSCERIYHRGKKS